jgi:hypothetical protein
MSAPFFLPLAAKAPDRSFTATGTFHTVATVTRPGKDQCKDIVILSDTQLSHTALFSKRNHLLFSMSLLVTKY